MAFCLSESDKSARPLAPLILTTYAPAILIFHAPKRVRGVFYYQIFNVYALLITCSASLFQENITRFHASVAIFIATPPVSIYFLIYSIRALWGQHRLDTVLGREHHLNRGLVFFAAGMWVSILIYTSLRSTKGRFAQDSCDTITAQEVLVSKDLGGAPVFIIGIAAFSWLISIALARKEIWSPGQRYRPKFATVW
jgi:hypothetical protein